MSGCVATAAVEWQLPTNSVAIRTSSQREIEDAFFDTRTLHQESAYCQLGHPCESNLHVPNNRFEVVASDKNDLISTTMLC